MFWNKKQAGVQIETRDSFTQAGNKNILCQPDHIPKR
jgi:hypothetical protein